MIKRRRTGGRRVRGRRGRYVFTFRGWVTKATNLYRAPSGAPSNSIIAKTLEAFIAAGAERLCDAWNV